MPQPNGLNSSNNSHGRIALSVFVDSHCRNSGTQGQRWRKSGSFGMMVSRFAAFVVLLIAMSNALRVVPVTLTDGQLVERALAGDAWAQSTIYQRHAPRLLNTAARLMSDREDGMDVVQEVFVEALDALEDLRQPEALGTWLLKRLVNRATRRLSRRRWAQRFSLLHARELSLATLAQSACPAEVRAELDRLSALLEALPARQRVAWVMHRVEGETLPAIAELTETSLATVKRDIAAAQLVINGQTKEA
jgi:RNA polymerase sigma-70 factor (ECF subfamily)